MKEQDTKTIEEMNLEQLTVLEDLLYLEEYDGKDVAEALAKIQEEIGKKVNRYEGHTREELENLLAMAERLEENDGICMTETIIKIEEVLWPKVDSGIIYEAESPSPNRLDRT